MAGQAKARQRAHAKLLASHPACIYCAGANPATTIEHMPPIMMFDQRQRPKVLESPTCERCNHGTRLTDLVASLLDRVYPDSENDPDRKELKKLLIAVRNNVPGLRGIGCASGHDLFLGRLSALILHLEAVEAHNSMMT